MTYRLFGIFLSPARAYRGEMAPPSATYRPRAMEQGFLHTVMRQHLETFLVEARLRLEAGSFPAHHLSVHLPALDTPGHGLEFDGTSLEVLCAT
jgi:hypothetical protein